MQIGATDYRNAANERLVDAFFLLREGQFAGCVYLGGRAVERMLRALIWRADREYAMGKKALETGHNLREMLELAMSLGILQKHEAHREVAADVQKVARLWWNNM